MTNPEILQAEIDMLAAERKEERERQISTDRHNLSAEALAAADLVAELREQLEGDDDEQLLRDMIEGETSYNEAMQAAYERYLFLKGERDAAADRLKQIRARKDITLGRMERLKARMLQAVETVGTPFRLAGECTIFTAQSPPKMVLTVPPDDVPIEYLRVQYAPDMEAIKKAFNEGKDVPFAAQVSGSKHLVIRRS